MSFLDLANNEGFRTGLAVGFAALVASLIFVVVVRTSDRSRTGRRPGRTNEPRAPIAGYVVALAGVVALEQAYPGSVTGRLLAGLVLLALAPTVVAVVDRRRRVGRLTTAAAALPGAVVVARVSADVNPLAWVEALVVVGIVVGGALAADVDRFHARAGLGPVLLSVTVTGCYVTLPDTEFIATLLGVALPLTLLGFPVALATLGSGIYVALGLLAWVAAVEGRGRGSAVVGAFACLGVLAIEPPLRRALGSRARVLKSPCSGLTLAVIGLQVGIVLVTSRIAGLEPSATRAGVISLGAWIAGAGVLALLLYQRPPRPHAAGGAEPRAAPVRRPDEPV